MDVTRQAGLLGDGKFLAGNAGEQVVREFFDGIGGGLVSLRGRGEIVEQGNPLAWNRACRCVELPSAVKSACRLWILLSVA